MNYRAAIKTKIGTVLVPSRSHTYHVSRSAALRAVERIAKRLHGDTRGYLWPLAAGDVTTADLENTMLPNWVETVAL